MQQIKRNLTESEVKDVKDVVLVLVPSLITLVGVIITVIVENRSTRNDVANKLTTAQAVTDTKIEELTREVREHNNFARRMPVVEEQIKVINHRIEDLEDTKKGA